jgi:hypothetical protein
MLLVAATYFLRFFVYKSSQSLKLPRKTTAIDFFKEKIITGIPDTEISWIQDESVRFGVGAI